MENKKLLKKLMLLLLNNTTEPINTCRLKAVTMDVDLYGCNEGDCKTCSGDYRLSGHAFVERFE